MGHNLWAVLADASATDLSLASGGGFSGFPSSSSTGAWCSPSSPTACLSSSGPSYIFFSLHTQGLTRGLAA